MTDNGPGEFIRFGSWLVRTASIDALGPDAKDPDTTILVVRGVKLYLERGEAAELWRQIDNDAGWQK